MPITPKHSADALVKNKALSHFLNFSRALAAVLVLFFHIRTALVVPYDSLQVHNWLTRTLFAATSFGHDAVIIFFVLSGYLVGGAVLKLDLRSSHDLWGYWVDRIVRIAPVLIATIGFSIILQREAPLFECNDSSVTILGNILALQNVFVRPLCNNLPLWSISNEVVYYFVFPVMIAALSRLFSVWLAVSIVFVLLICIWSLGLAPWDDTNIVLDFPFWLIGAGLWFIPDRFNRLRWLALLMLSAALLFGRLDAGKNYFWFRDLFLAASFSFLLVTFLNQPMPKSGVRATVATYFANWSRWFAEFSFSLYVIHYPLIRLYIYFGLNSGLHGTRYTAITPLIAAEFVGLGAFCILIALGFSWLFERPRRFFKRTIVARLGIS
jgi:peptidoglycan/LPS O-acetylase OafA/YrhL